MNVCCDAETEGLGIATTNSDLPVNESTSLFYGCRFAFFVYSCIIYDFLIWLRGHDLNVRPSGYEPEQKTGIALKVKLYSGLKILTCKNTCKSCGSVSVSAVLQSYTTIFH